MDSAKIIELLNQEPEMNPDLHDGSYELMREIVESYSHVEDYSVLNYKDLNAVYAMAIGTWKLNVEKKKEYVNAGHLPEDEKETMSDVIDDVWDKACRGKYSNREGKGPSIGMFGTGFYSFERITDDLSCRKFIKLLVDIADLTDDNEIFNRTERVFDNNFKGMQAAAASVILHCLKPNTFPILNSNYNAGTIYSALGINLQNEKRLINYVDNCRKIKQFRDSRLTIKNYRILDNYPRIHPELFSDETHLPGLEEYDPDISKEQYLDMLQDSEVVNKNWLDTIYYIYLLNGEASCTAVANMFGDTAQHYSAHATAFAKAIQSATNCKLSEREDGSERYWAIPFYGRYADSTHFSWKLREPLFDAIEELDEDGFFDFLKPEENTNMEATISKNTILYGPPGTGKTYNTVIYAVSIIENKALEDVENEAAADYEAVKTRYDEYFAKGQVAFTTFHQSYGYEEFIEGIRPVMTDGENEVGYRIEPGVFKEFCDRASIPAVLNNHDYGINKDPAVWKVSLGGAHDNPVRTDCMENEHIRIGWDDYGPDVSDRLDELPSGKRVLNAFLNVMRIGDIVLSCYSSTEIDAVGVVTGDYEWDDSYNSYKRLRKVKWLVKNIRENIVEINKGYQMTLATVYWMEIPVREILNIVERHRPQQDKPLNGNESRFVFIIDEINRGNISKIFGELITLIEESKRIGAPESMTVELPYSHSSFGVPNNVYILGTMNTADRSIAIMDTALRRRFSFVEMLPDSAVLRQFGNPTVFDNGISVNIADMLDIINDRITFLYDREHTIGHAFFMPLKDSPTVDTLAQIFEKSIIPLLQEYFYEDYAKIQLVLGDDGKTGDNKQYQFISDEEMDANKIFETIQELDSEKKYSINYPAFRKIESYKLISKKL